MPEKASRFEIFVDSLMPFAILALIIIIVADIFFSKFSKQYSLFIDLIDLAVIWLFAMDMIFKLKHAKSIPRFLREHWFYIIAIFPFFLVIRLLERFYQISLSAASSQTTILLGRYISTFLKESRILKGIEIFRFLNISARLVRAFYFYENPKVRHKINIRKLLKVKKKKR